jgi:hypothetical protein
MAPRPTAAALSRGGGIIRQRTEKEIECQTD